MGCSPASRAALWGTCRWERSVVMPAAREALYPLAWTRLWLNLIPHDRVTFAMSALVEHSCVGLSQYLTVGQITPTCPQRAQTCCNHSAE